jgi:glycosyltransferase involved in cell wall biosynthesis
MNVMDQKVRIVHIINSFQPGGAEAMLCSLLERTDRERFEPSVVSLIDELQLAGPVIKSGIPVTVMGLRPGIFDPRGPIRLMRHLRKLRPDVVQTWMDHSNLIGGIAARMVPGTKTVWGIHHSNHIPHLTKRSTLMTVWMCARLSRQVPSKIVYCSQYAGKLYSERGFVADRMEVIPNGFDTARFHADRDARGWLRNELGLDPKTQLIGLVARYDPLKDHANFIRAAGILNREFPDVHFVLCGTRVDSGNSEITAQIASLGIGNRCHLLGQRKDVARIHAALDIATSSSVSEAFPLAVGEAMACGVPCVATDVGDSAMMIGQTGRIVPPSDSQALAAGWAEILKMDAGGRARLGAEARRRVCELFDLGAVVRRYESLYHELAGTQAQPSPRQKFAVAQSTHAA